MSGAIKYGSRCRARSARSELGERSNQIRIVRRRAEEEEGTCFRPRVDDEVGGCRARSARSELGERSNQMEEL